MGPVKSVNYDVADEEKGEMEVMITLDFKAQASESRDRIKGCFNQLSEQKISAIMTSPDNPELKKAFDHLH